MNHIKKYFYFFLVFVLLTGCSNSLKIQKEPEISKIRMIANLATIKVYYNNVAIFEKDKSYFLQKDRKMFIEYQGSVKIGIDMSKLNMKFNGDNIIITIPNAEILEEPNISDIPDDSYYFSKDNLIFKNKITTEDKQKVIEESKKNMIDSIEKNDETFKLAKDRAKKLIENYIYSLGEISGKHYKIEWNEID